MMDPVASPLVAAVASSSSRAQLGWLNRVIRIRSKDALAAIAQLHVGFNISSDSRFLHGGALPSRLSGVVQARCRAH